MRRSIFRTTAVLALMFPAAPAAIRGQVANPLPQAIGLGGNYTALANGFGAVAWNPAGLGMPGSAGFSFTLLPFNVAAGLGPITMADLVEYDGELIPESARRDWLEQIREEGGEFGSFGTDLTYAAFSIGRFAVSATSSARARVDLAPDVAEVLFFGNAGLTGQPGSYTLAGSSFDVAGTTTLAGSFAVPLALSLGPLPDQHFSIGATLKYTIGNFLILGQEDGSSLESDPIAVDFRFPMVHTAFPDTAGIQDLFQDVLNNGTGIGLDVGAAWQAGMFSAGVVIRNLVSTFEWDTEALRFREGTALWNADTAYTNLTESAIEDAPPAVTDRISSLYTFSPVLTAGAAAHLTPLLTVTGEVRHSLEDNLDVGSQNHLGVGAELRLVPFIPLRAGVALISGGYQLSGGLGLRVAAVELSAAAAYRDGEFGSGTAGAIGLTFGIY